MEHCNYYIYASKLDRPLIGTESKPIRPDDTQKHLHAQQKVCVRPRKLPDGGQEAAPSSKTVTWRLSVSERAVAVAPLPHTTITVTPKKPDGEEL